MKLITQESMARPEVLRWHRRLRERYIPPSGITISVILPCSARKPYSLSRSHTRFREYIRRGARGKLPMVHEVVLTSPLGIVPRELEGVYPASSYDIPVTGHWSSEEKEIGVSLLRDYLAKAGTRTIAHVDGAYREICGLLGVPMTQGKLLSQEGLRELEEGVRAGLEADPGPGISRGERVLEDLRRVADFQFGRGAGGYIIPNRVSVRGGRVYLEGKQVAAVRRDGLLALTIEGARLLLPYEKYTARLNFKPGTRSIFAAGIEEADGDIRPEDEVITLYKGEVVGVGRALLNGEEMVRSKKGLALALRHRA